MLTSVTTIFNYESSIDDSLFDSESKLYLSFLIETDFFGVHIDNIIEVKSFNDVKIRRLINAPDFLLGIFNLRGNIIPIVDMRLKWKCQQHTYNDKTAIIILSINKKVWAIVVDKINEVASIKKENILPAPRMSAKLDTKYLQGVASRQDYSLILLDIEKLMTSDEMGLIDSIQNMKD